METTDSHSDEDDLYLMSTTDSGSDSFEFDTTSMSDSDSMEFDTTMDVMQTTDSMSESSEDMDTTMDSPDMATTDSMDSEDDDVADTLDEEALDNTDTLHKTVQTILEERQAVANALNEIDFVVKVFPSDANFLLFQLQSKAKEVYQAMANGGIVTRYRGNELHCDECIRVTIGTPEENRAFLESLVKTYRSL